MEMIEHRKNLRRAIPRRHVFGDRFLIRNIVHMTIGIDDFHDSSSEHETRALSCGMDRRRPSSQTCLVTPGLVSAQIKIRRARSRFSQIPLKRAPSSDA
jgi:hypothetical protein